MTSFQECVTCLATGQDGTHPCRACSGFGMIEDEDVDEWDEYEEDGPMDLEDQLDRALDKSFPPTVKSAQ